MSPDTSAFLAHEFLGNSIKAYIMAASIFATILVVLIIIKRVIISRLQKLAEQTSTDIDDFVVRLLQKLGLPVYLFVAIYVGSQSLTLTERINSTLQTLLIIILTIKGVQLLQECISYFLKKWAEHVAHDDPTSQIAIKNITAVTKVLLWAGGLVFILDNLGINITAAVAGLGIGGIAVALAAQAMLGDAFSSFAIFMDRPFAVGDFIIVGDLLGTVEYIGFKTTRIRSLGGEQLIFSNSDLTSSRIRNYKRMEQRRVIFKLGVVYQTSVDQLRTIPKIIEGIIKESKLARFDRAHFQSYGDFALIFEVVFYVLTPDYNKYMDVQQDINLRIAEEFQKAKIEFAYPTQQLYVTKVEPPA